MTFYFFGWLAGYMPQFRPRPKGAVVPPRWEVVLVVIRNS